MYKHDEAEEGDAQSVEPPDEAVKDEDEDNQMTGHGAAEAHLVSL